MGFYSSFASTIHGTAASILGIIFPYGINNKLEFFRYYHFGNFDKSNQILQEIKALSEKSPGGSPSFYVAMINLRMGEIDAAFEWLDKASEERQVELYWLNDTPHLSLCAEIPAGSRCSIKWGSQSEPEWPLLAGSSRTTNDR